MAIEKRQMRGLIVLIALVSVAAGAADAGAKVHRKKLHQEAKQPRLAAPSNRANDYVVHDAERLPYGSSVWWQQMLREGRAGTCCN
jgi:hypothetical protein